MKNAIVILSVILVANGAVRSAPSGISLLSEQHRVWGEAGTDSTQPGELPGGIYQSYDLTASHSISGSATGIEVLAGSEPYSVTASSSAGSFGLSASGARYTAAGYAESLYVFQPEESTRFVALDVSGTRSGHPFEIAMELILKDLTSATILEQSNWPEWQGDPDLYWGESFAWTQTYAVDRAHTYSLHLYLDARGGDWLADAFVGAGLRAVPAPGAILLGVLGTGLVGRLRRWQAI